MNLFSLIIILFLFAFKSINSPNEFTLMESWQEKYRGYNATGSHVVALWSFDNKKIGAMTNPVMETVLHQLPTIFQSPENLGIV